MARRLGLTLLGLAGLLACTRDVPPPDYAPPQGDARDLILLEARAAYPGIPDDMAGMLVNVRMQLADDANCRLAEWLALPASGAQADVQALSRRLVDYCAMGTADLTAANVETRLNGEDFRFDIVGDELTMLARSNDTRVDICCSLQLQMSRIGPGPFWAARRRMADIDKSMLALFVSKPERTPEADIQRFRGANAPYDPRQVATPALRGQVVEREMRSDALDETRRLSIYLPPGWSKDRTWPAIFLTDNAAGVYAGLVEAMIADGKIAPVVLISAQSGRRGVVGVAPTQYGSDLRSAEYIRYDAPDDRFDRHMKFFTQELAAYAAREFNVSTQRADRAVAGYSSGGVFALWAGLLHPEVYALAIPMSPGLATLTAGDLSTGVRARFRFAGGTYEPSFLETAKAAEAVLDGGGYDATGRYLAAGHDPDQWRVVMYEALKEFLPPA